MDKIMDKIIFLDIDGVLNTDASRQRNGFESVEFSCIEVLSVLLDQTSAKKRFKSILERVVSAEMALKINSAIVDKTDPGGKFIILYDDAEIIDILTDAFILTDDEFGLTEKIAAQTVKKLESGGVRK